MYLFFKTQIKMILSNSKGEKYLCRWAYKKYEERKQLN